MIEDGPDFEEVQAAPFSELRESFHSDMSQRVNEVELIVKDVEQTVYDNPKKSLIYAHENNVNEG